ncbi:MAG: acyltransferase [Chloroflexota bacterium]|nr:acyltransferase [Chloroflexota bacterium]
MIAAPQAANGARPTEVAPQNNERSFRPDIEGLRALAVGVVLLNHAGVGFMSGGYVGVDVFFVLSGFLITGILLREAETTGTISLVRFYARRARRLLPAGVLVLVATVAASHLLIGGARADRIATDARWTALFASNYRFIQQGTDYMDSTLPPSPLQHYWSLAVEEQFYVVWPLLLMAVAAISRGRNLRLASLVALAFVVAGSFAWSVHNTELNGTAAYFSPFTRAWELGLGGLLALAAPQLRRFPAWLSAPAGWAGLAAIVTAAIRFDAETVFPGYTAALPVVGACLVVAAGTISADRGVERVLAFGPAQLLGRLSYSLYLWHWPVLVIGAAWADRALSTRENLLLCVLAIGLSLITYHAIEQPVRDSERLRKAHPRWSLGMGAALTAVALLAVGISMQLRPSQPVLEVASTGTLYLPDQAQVLRAVREATEESDWPAQPKRIANPAYSKECNVTRADTSANVCVHGDPNGSRTMVMFGDSHGAMWIPALDVIGREQGWRVVQLTKPGCQAPDFPRYSPTMKREYTECAEFRTWALDQIDDIRPDLVVIASSSRDVEAWVDGAPSRDNIEQTWANGLRTVLTRIQGAAGRVVLLGEMPYPAEPGIDCLTAHTNDIEECSTPLDEALVVGTREIEQGVAAEFGIKWVDTVPWFCSEQECPAVVGGLTTHRDNFHTAENYAVWLSNVLGQAIGVIPEGRELTAVTLPGGGQ